LKTGKRQTSGPFSNSSEVAVRNYRLVSLLLVPGKIMEELRMETMSTHMKAKGLGRSSKGLEIANFA